MRNVDKIRKLKVKNLAKLFNYQYAEACEMCGFRNVCNAVNEMGEDSCDCNEGTRLWLKQEYNKEEKPWSVYKK